MKTLLESFPVLCKEWDYERNKSLLPSAVKPHSNRYVWWRCEKGHSWRAKINNRTSFSNQCPYCSGTRAIPGETDLASTFPEIASLWHPTKNGDLLPSQVTAKSNKAIVWICQFGHEWTTKVYHRTDGSDCPFCSGQKPVVGKTDLQTVNPSLSKEWHPTKNSTLTPSKVTAFSHSKVWWKGVCGHEWCARVYDRSKGQDCPVCSGHRIIKGVNDFATSFPKIAIEWDYMKNGEVLPDSVASHSNKSVWWRCSEGHSWKTNIKNRANGTGCPYCNQNKLIPGKNSLDVINPTLASEWHPTKNGTRTPHTTTAFCNDIVWWKCEQGHEWQATVSNRSNRERCPYCCGRKPIFGKTDFSTLFTKLALEWHPTKNAPIKPSDVSAFSNVKYWWMCKDGHEWQATVATRSYGSSCPHCIGRKPVAEKSV